MGNVSFVASLKGIGVSASGQEGAARLWARSVGECAADSEAGTGKMGAAILSALEDAGFGARVGNLRTYVAVESSRDAPVKGMLAEAGLGAARYEVVEAQALFAAMQALERQECDVAVAATLGDDGRVSTALCLTRADARGGRSYSEIRLAEGGALLGDACEGVGWDAASVTLLALPGRDVAAVVPALAGAMPRAKGAVPYCHWMSVDGDEPQSAVATLALAVYQRLLPPSGVEANAVLKEESVWPLCGAEQVRPWIARGRRRGAMLLPSVGGRAAWLLVEEPVRRVGPPPRLRRTALANLVLLGAVDQADLQEQLGTLAKAESVPAKAASATGGVRAALVVRDAADLREKAARLLTRLQGSETKGFHTPDGIFYRAAVEAPGKVAFLFPGQGAQYLGMLGELCLDVPALQHWFERLEESCEGNELCMPSQVIAPASVGLDEASKRLLNRKLFEISCGGMAQLAASLGLEELLGRCGIRPDAMLGYSNGENAALVASGIWHVDSASSVFRLLRNVGRHDSGEQARQPQAVGKSVAVNRAPRVRIDAAVAASAGRLYLALDNCPDQVVLFGHAETLAELTTTLRSEGAICFELPFDRGHHTPLFAAAGSLKRMYADAEIGTPRMPLYSCASAAPFPSQPDAIRELASSQWTRCVRFGETVERMYADGVRTFLEIGPGGSLTGFVHSCLRRRPHVALASNLQGRPDLQQLYFFLADLFVQGHAVDLAGLEPVVETEEPEVAVEGAVRSVGASESTVQRTGASSGEALAILQAHFELMREFAASQQRVLERLGLHLGAQAQEVVVEAGEEFETPLLGMDFEIVEAELQARRTFRPETDPFLHHHAFGRKVMEAVGDETGLPVMAFTGSMALAVEAACRLAGQGASQITMRDLRAVRWLAAEEALSVQVEAKRGAEGAIRVSVAEETVAGGALAFSAEVFPGQGVMPPPLPPLVGARASSLGVELFHSSLFHGPLFHSLRSVTGVSEAGIEAVAVVPPAQGLFQGTQARPLVPFTLLDAAGQLVAFWLRERGQDLLGLFPLGAEEYVQSGPVPEPGAVVRMRAAIVLTGSLTDATVELMDEAGRVFARLAGFKMRLYGSADPTLRWLLSTGEEALPDGGGRLVLPSSSLWEADSIWTRLLARRVFSPVEQLAAQRLSPAERVERVWATLLVKQVVFAGTSTRLSAGDVEWETPFSARVRRGSGETETVVSLTRNGQELTAQVEPAAVDSQLSEETYA